MATQAVSHTSSRTTDTNITFDATAAQDYLTNLLNRTLHVHTNDGRTFVGQLKCTDNEGNVILSMTHELRQPGPEAMRRAAEAHELERKTGNVVVDMRKRFVGLVVVPGWCVTKVELEG